MQLLISLPITIIKSMWLKQLKENLLFVLLDLGWDTNKLLPPYEHRLLLMNLPTGFEHAVKNLNEFRSS